jgi:hypothetical protein
MNRRSAKAARKPSRRPGHRYQRLGVRPPGINRDGSSWQREFHYLCAWPEPSTGEIDRHGKVARTNSLRRGGVTSLPLGSGTFLWCESLQSGASRGSPVAQDAEWFQPAAQLDAAPDLEPRVAASQVRYYFACGSKPVSLEVRPLELRNCGLVKLLMLPFARTLCRMLVVAGLIGISGTAATGCHHDSPFGPGLNPRQQRQAEQQVARDYEAATVRTLSWAKSVIGSSEGATLFHITNGFDKDFQRSQHNRTVDGYPILETMDLGEEDRRKIGEALLLRSSWVATSAEELACLFQPRHVVEFKRPANSLDVVICFTCRDVVFRSNSRSEHLVLSELGRNRLLLLFESKTPRS